MHKTLVIVESPAKAKTISRYLGKKYIINASVGHIRDLPPTTVGVDVKNSYKPLYVIMKGKEKKVKELKHQLSEVDNVLIATDPDREGEAIAWHLANILKINPESRCRISFNEITDKAVCNAVENPRPIDLNLVNAQQARRILDRLVGFELSPLLWTKVKKGLSAGRVQSVATKMLVDRELEIENFKSEEYWYLDQLFECPNLKNTSFTARYFGIYDEKSKKIKKHLLKSEDEVKTLIDFLKKSDYKILNVEKKNKKRHPFPPFTTSSLQQDAAHKLNFSSKKTMSIAQQLYEGIDIEGLGTTALVTYIRTDSVRISTEALQSARDIIASKYGKDYLPEKVNIFKNKNSAQDAHEAIRPAHFDIEPEQIKNQLSKEQFELYKLIWDRFLASQMSDCRSQATTINVINQNAIFRANGECIIFEGFRKIYNIVKNNDGKENSEEGNEEIKILPPLTMDSILTAKSVNQKASRHFTKPPARYNEASLIKAMEEAGIGRPSTYAPTISTILERQYVEKEQKQLKPTELGKLVTKMLEDNFAKIIDLKFTAQMEEKLDTVEIGEKNWINVLDDFYPDFHELILAANANIEKYKAAVVELEEICPLCQAKLLLKDGKFGKFIACSSFPNCKYTKNIDTTINAHCPKCFSPLESRRTKKGKIFYVCAKQNDRKDCDFISWYLPVDGKKCEYCGSYIVKKQFKSKSYETCSNPDCIGVKKTKSK